MAKTGKKSVVKSAVRYVNLEEIRVDPSYQREVIAAAVTRIKKGFVAEALGVPLIAQRDDGTFWAVDGLQRITALKSMGKTKVLAEVFHSDGPEYEAQIFRLVNKNRTKLTPGHLFHALLTEGDETAWAIKEAVEKAGFALRLNRQGKNATSAHREVACVNTLLKLFKDTGGTESISFALDAIGKAWDNDPLATYNYVIAGLGLFHHKHEGGVDMDRLVPRLQTTTPGKLIYSAGLGNWDKATNMVEVLGVLYRKRLSARRGQ